MKPPAPIHPPTALNKYPRALAPVVAVVFAAIVSAGCRSTMRYGPDISAGDVVRVECADGSRTTGTVTERDDSSLHVDAGAGPVAIELQSLRGIERYNGRDAYGDEGLLTGAATGFAAGLFIAVHDWSNNGGFSLFGSDPHTDGTPIVVGTIVGGLAGLLIGHNIEHDSWQRVPLDRVGIGVEPTHDGTRAGVFWHY